MTLLARKHQAAFAQMQICFMTRAVLDHFYSETGLIGPTSLGDLDDHRKEDICE